MLHIQGFTFNHFQENTYVLWDETGSCMVVDPGCYFPEEKEQLKSFIEENKLKLELLVNTHCHIDHVLGNDFVIDTWKLPLHLHQGELKTYTGNSAFAAMFGIPKPQIPENLIFLEPNSEIKFGNTSFQVLFTPGHSVASVSFYQKENKILLAGDVLFKQSIGRTDLPGGNHQQLIDSIKQVLFKLPDECIVFSGHGPSTTLGEEKLNNPYLR